VTTVRIYQWDLPEDLEPLREAARRVAAGEFGAALFTTSIQVAHLFRIAGELAIEQQVRDGLANLLVASIGPTTSEALEEYGVRVDFEPSHAKMGVLVAETAQFAASRQ
jgi:uroporphyrinogen-III synthase